MQKCQEVSLKVLACFAIGLGFEEDFFTKVSSLTLAPHLLAPCQSLQKSSWPLKHAFLLLTGVSIQANQSHIMDQGLMPCVSN